MPITSKNPFMARFCRSVYLPERKARFCPLDLETFVGPCSHLHSEAQAAAEAARLSSHTLRRGKIINKNKQKKVTQKAHGMAMNITGFQATSETLTTQLYSFRRVLEPYDIDFVRNRLQFRHGEQRLITVDRSVNDKVAYRESDRRANDSFCF